MKSQAHEFLLAGNMLQGDAPAARLNASVIFRFPALCHFPVRIRIIGSPADPGHILKKIPRVKFRFRNPGSPEPFGTVPVCILQIHKFSFCHARQSKTSSTARMPTSIILSSGSFVVIFWTHIPGRLKRLTSTLSLFPASRMIS